ncbi:hypothetical protein QQ045_019480 [Rhodiola kirilowii]
MKRLSKASNSRSGKTRATSAHVTEHSYDPVDDFITTQKPKFASLYDQQAVADDVAEEEEEDEQTGYVLRQKPRKKILRSKNVVNQDQLKKFICSKCGKGFQSSKAMCGHMACHSEKEKPLRNVYAKQKQLQLVMDSQSDTESGAKNNNLRIRRSRRMIGYKKVDDDPAADSKAKVDVFNNCSSGDSGVEQEQEEVAISLMMLSRDSANWCGLNSIGDSSDNNSVVLEDRSVGTKFGKRDGFRRFGYDVDESVKKYGSKKVETLGDSESGSVRNGDKNVVTDPNIRISKKRKLDEGSKAEPHLSLKKLKSVMDGGFKYGLSQTERPKMDLYPRKSVANESYAAGYNVASNQYSNAEIHRRFEHKVPIHSQSHRAFDANATPNHRSSTVENSFENDGSSNMRKGKGILEYRTGNVGECLISSKLFRSDQARSSHRRVHLAERTEEINKCDEVSTTFKRNGDQLHEFIDLNLPAPTEDEEASESMGSYSRFQPLHF